MNLTKSEPIRKHVLYQIVGSWLFWVFGFPIQCFVGPG